MQTMIQVHFDSKIFMSYFNEIYKAIIFFLYIFVSFFLI